MRPREGVRAADAEERQGATSMTTAQWTATYPRGGKGLVKGYLAKTQRDLVSHSLKPKRTAPVWTQVWRSSFREKQGGFMATGVRDEFAGGWASLLGGLGRGVAARITDRS